MGSSITTTVDLFVHARTLHDGVALPPYCGVFFSLFSVLMDEPWMAWVDVRNRLNGVSSQVG